MKHILTIFILAITLFTGKAQSTSQDGEKEGSLYVTYAKLSQLPNVTSLTTQDPLVLISPDVLDSVKISAATNLNAQQVLQCGNAVYDILSDIGLEYMINGGNNKLSMCFVYAKPISSDRYEVLLVGASGYIGLIGIIYGTTDEKTINLIQQAPFYMHGATLNLELGLNEKGNRVYLFNINM